MTQTNSNGGVTRAGGVAAGILGVITVISLGACGAIGISNFAAGANGDVKVEQPVVTTPTDDVTNEPDLSENAEDVVTDGEGASEDRDEVPDSDLSPDHASDLGEKHEEGVDDPLGVDDVYLIQKGDTLSRVSGDVGVSVDHLVEFNGIKNPNLIYADSALMLTGD